MKLCYFASPMEVAEKKKVEKDEEYIAMLTEYENGLLSFKVDQEELWSKIQIQPADIQRSFLYPVHHSEYLF